MMTSSFGFKVSVALPRLRDIIAEPETSAAGNVILRVGTENEPQGKTYSADKHVVLTPDEALEYAGLLLKSVGESATGPRAMLLDSLTRLAIEVQTYPHEG